MTWEMVQRGFRQARNCVIAGTVLCFVDFGISQFATSSRGALIAQVITFVVGIVLIVVGVVIGIKAKRHERELLPFP